ncbi:MAG: tRNA (adenosine(37)-N6)-threonylcarbamoyltransferase complex dimerization subunit type 1 TsaB [Clostridiales bacterium]|nr:tRNA (adenosine(37)-N6)-threonylcarbamoyltransferase complex dimerization subunit type 1 TsaB [Clostridiales bacterium]
MKLLAVDTSGPVAGVAVFQDGRLAYEGAAVNRMTHSVNMMPMIEEALSRSGLDISEIDLYAAVTGPGSFTGVRIGVSAIKGMAHGAGKPCVGVDALEALAAGLYQTKAVICPIQDARAGQVYGAAFRGDFPPQRLLPDMAEKLGDYLERVLSVAQPEEKLCFVGDGVATYRTAIEEALGERALFAPAHCAYLRPAAVAALADAHQQDAVDYLALAPVYLRAPQAERARAAKEGKQA